MKRLFVLAVAFVLCGIVNVQAAGDEKNGHAYFTKAQLPNNYLTCIRTLWRRVMLTAVCKRWPKQVLTKVYKCLASQNMGQAYLEHVRCYISGTCLWCHDKCMASDC